MLPAPDPDTEGGREKVEARSSNLRVFEVAGLLPLLTFRVFEGFFDILIKYVYNLQLNKD